MDESICSTIYCDITAVQWYVYCAVVRSAACSAPIGLYTTSLLGVVQFMMNEHGTKHPKGKSSSEAERLVSGERPPNFNPALRFQSGSSSRNNPAHGCTSCTFQWWIRGGGGGGGGWGHSKHVPPLKFDRLILFYFCPILYQNP